MGDQGVFSRRTLLIGGAAAAIGGGAVALLLTDSAPEMLAGPVRVPRRLRWNDLRPSTNEAEAPVARVAAAPGGGPDGAGLTGYVSHRRAVASDWVDGAALDTSPAADAPFSWESRPPRPEDLVQELHNQLIALPGYVVPLDLAKDGTRTFLLAPYVGACIHVPPPPANQIVLVTSQKPYRFERMFEAVAVTGVMRAEPATSRLAEVGYQIEATRIAPFDPETEGASWLTG